MKVKRRPHILFILADDLGYADIGYKNDQVSTPVLDHLANNGIKLDKYYVQPVCSPSRAQLLTGRYAMRLGLQHLNSLPPQPNGVPLSETLLPELLSKCGYRTELVGKWHLGMFQTPYLPQNRGFDHFFGLYGGTANFRTHENCFRIPDGTKMCGYDFHEATRNNPGIVRFDLNGTYSQGSEDELNLDSLGTYKAPLHHN